MNKLKNKKIFGFEYYIDEEIIKNYRKKPIEHRLKWLYFGNILHKGNKRIEKLHDMFRLK